MIRRIVKLPFVFAREVLRAVRPADTRLHPSLVPNEQIDVWIDEQYARRNGSR